MRAEYTKTKSPRVAFISTEAKESVLEWLKVRDQYIDSAVEKSSYEKVPKERERRLLPFELSTAYAMWKNALRKAGFSKKIDPSTKRRIFHPHVLRKFFRTKMGAAILVDMVEAMMGHEAYLTEVYRRHGVEDLASQYKRGEHLS